MNSKQRMKKKQGGRIVGRNQQIPHPPMFAPNMVHKEKLRFICTTASPSETNVSITNLLNLISVSLSTTSLQSLALAVKFEKISLWAPGGITTTGPIASPSTIVVRFPEDATTTNIGTNEKFYMDTSIGVTEPAHLSVRPPPKSWQASWQNTSGGTSSFCTLICPLGTVIDLVYKWTIGISEFARPEQPGAVTITGPAFVGFIYLSPLDGQASGKFTPAPGFAFIT